VPEKVATTGLVFLDTNILVDCADTSDLTRQQLCRRILQDLLITNRAVISTQILQEFFVVATKKLGIAANTARVFVSDFRIMETVIVTPDLIDQAIGLQQSAVLSFWDSLVISAAHHAGCETILTADLNAGQVISDVEVVRPESFEEI
jgi:predicted nucleic acid-binding protein